MLNPFSRCLWLADVLVNLVSISFVCLSIVLLLCCTSKNNCCMHRKFRGKIFQDGSPIPFTALGFLEDACADCPCECLWTDGSLSPHLKFFLEGRNQDSLSDGSATQEKAHSWICHLLLWPLFSSKEEPVKMFQSCLFVQLLLEFLLNML